MLTTAPHYENKPLITMAALKADWQEVLSIDGPSWAYQFFSPAFDDGDLEEADSDSANPFTAPIGCVVGRKYKTCIQLTPICLAILLEITRLRNGHRVVTNSNFNKPVPQVYAKLAFKNAPHHLVSIRRIFSDAPPSMQTKALGVPNDYSPENTYAEPHPHPRRNARDTAMHHVERLACERAAAGQFPMGFTVDAYLANLRDLFAALDAHARGSVQ
jgi:hypothetical protein